MNRKALVQSIGFLAGIAAAATNAHAWLGGFEQADGYQPFLNYTQNYNAGQFGPNGGYGGGFSAITPNTGLWTAVSGGFSSGGSSLSYATGHQWHDRSWWNGTGGALNDQALQLTTNHQGWGGPALEYKYNIDAPDLGGVNPLTTGGSIVKVSFWWMSELEGVDSGGLVPEGYFGNAVQFRDSSNNVGFQLGLKQHAVGGDKVTLWNGSSLFETPIPAGTNKYDRWDLTFDLANDTFSADYFDFTASTLFTLATNQPMMTPMSDLSILDFRTSPGVTNEKQYGMNLDDFTMGVQVPEPTTISAISVLGTALLMRRPRRK